MVGRRRGVLAPLAPLLLALALLAGCTVATPTPAATGAAYLVKPGGPVTITPAPTATAAAAQASTTSASTSAATTAPTAVPPSPLPPAASGCRSGNPLANVYHPTRLQVLSPCAIVTGTVALEHNDEADGDYHINVMLDPQFAGLINAENTKQEGGALVVEVVPADEPGCVVGQPPKPATGTYDYGTCTGADIPPPPIGAHVQVVGPWVLDTDHGWREIHPAWSITVLSGAAQPTTAAPVPPAGTAAVTITSVTGGSPGGTASVSVQTAPGASCSIVYRTPAGTKSTAAGLGGQTADSTGAASWSWKIGSSTKPGNGTVTVTCGGASASSPITIG